MPPRLPAGPRPAALPARRLSPEGGGSSFRRRADRVFPPPAPPAPVITAPVYMDEAPASVSRPDAVGSSRAAGEVRLPSDSLRRLSRLSGELGAGSVAVVREVGRSAGRALFDRLAESGDAGRMELDAFWSELRRAAAERGFGRVRYRVLDPDLGQIELLDSPEAAGSDSDPAAPGRAEPLPPRPGCHFAAGWIGGALSAAAGEPVAVLEVRCAADDDTGSCLFLVGEEPRLERIGASLRAGAASLEAAIEETAGER